MRHIFLYLATAIGLLGADATGTWTGTFTPAGDHSEPAHLVLKQEGTKITGTAGPRAEEQHQILNGKAEDGVITFEVQGGKALLKFVLKQDGEEITGDISRDEEGGKKTAKLTVKRERTT
jgi:hypothetical protein